MKIYVINYRQSRQKTIWFAVEVEVGAYIIEFAESRPRFGNEHRP